jgi:GxxExxY protein
LDDEYKHSELTEKIIGAAFNVHRQLGFGFLEKIYHNALIFELNDQELKVNSEVPIKVYYKSKIVGDYIADMIVEESVIIEIKADKDFNPIHEVQLINYLKATGIEIGLLINFGRSVDIRRKVFQKSAESASKKNS